VAYWQATGLGAPVYVGPEAAFFMVADVRFEDGYAASGFAIDDVELPSNISPSLSSSSPITPEHIERCCHLPLGSVKRRSTHSISPSLIAFSTLPASFAI
jgi:hypothetical protein